MTPRTPAIPAATAPTAVGRAKAALSETEEELDGDAVEEEPEEDSVDEEPEEESVEEEPEEESAEDESEDVVDTALVRVVDSVAVAEPAESVRVV